MAALLKAAALYIGVLAFSLGTFSLICIGAFDASLSPKGSALLVAGAAPFWAWACWRSEEPALRTFNSMLIYSAMLISLAFVVLLATTAMREPHRLAGWFVLPLLIAGAIFWYLRSVVIKRNQAADPDDAA